MTTAVLRRIVYLGFALPVSLQHRLDLLDAYPHHATYNFSWSLIRSLERISPIVDVVSSYEIRNFPCARKVFFGSRTIYESNRYVFIIGFVNIIIAKHLSRFILLFLRLKIVFRILGSDLLVVHGSHTPYMLAAMFFRLFGCRSILVLTDEHGYSPGSRSLVSSIISAIDYRIMQFLVRRFDGYLCLNDRFVSTFKLQRALVIPGIVSSEILSIANQKGDSLAVDSMFTVAYAGNLTEANGINILLDAFRLLTNERIKLRVFGRGPDVSHVIAAAERNKYIEYAGSIDRTDLLNELCAANLLVNPRPPKNRTNVYSFPSKLIEYAALGVPTLTGASPNIPSILSECFLYFEEATAECLAHAILRAKHSDSLGQIGNRAKTILSQCLSENRIGSLIAELVSTRK